MARPLSPPLAALLSLISLTCAAQLPPGAREVPAPEPAAEPRGPSGMQFQAPEIPTPKFEGTVRLSRIRIVGLSAFDPAELNETLAPWLGRDVTATDLAEAARAASEFLNRRGLYIAIAFFPEQPFVDGDLELRVVEGRIGRVTVEVDPKSRLRRDVVDKTLAPLQPGTLVARGEFDTPLLLLNDLPGVDVSPSLTRGSAPGTTDLHVRVSDQPVMAAQLRFDNHGIREYGRYRFRGNVRLRNPLGFGDLVTAEHFNSETGDNKLSAMSYSVPVNAAGTRLGVRYSEQGAHLGGDFEPLGYSVDWQRWKLTLDHPLLRTHDRNLVASLAFDHDGYEEQFAAVNFRSDVRQRYLTAGVEGDWTDRFLVAGRNLLRVEHQRGRVDLDTPAVAMADATGLRQNGEFHRTRVRAETLRTLSSVSGIAFSFEAQFASKNLDVGREIILSGPDGVRAYPYEELFADEGHIATLEYRHRLPAIGSWYSGLAGFFDMARGKINKEPLPGTTGNARTLAGYGVALAAGIAKGFEASLTLAWRTRDAPTSDPDHRPRYWFMARQQF